MSSLRTGSKVRLIGIPGGLEDSADFPTKSTFDKCLGHDFLIVGFNDLGTAEPVIESVTGNLGETVWVEPEFLELTSK